MRSLASRLLALWAMSLLACAAVAFLLLRLHDQSAAARLGRAGAVVSAACGLIRDRYSFHVSGWRGGPLDADTRTGLATVTAATLGDAPGVEGSIFGDDTPPRLRLAHLRRPQARPAPPPSCPASRAPTAPPASRTPPSPAAPPPAPTPSSSPPAPCPARSTTRPPGP